MQDVDGLKNSDFEQKMTLLDHERQQKIRVKKESVVLFDTIIFIIYRATLILLSIDRDWVMYLMKLPLTTTREHQHKDCKYL